MNGERRAFMIHLLATGGTIAMQNSAEAGGNIPALSGQALVELIGDVGRTAEIRVEDWERLPGVHRGPTELWAMRQRVVELVEGPVPPAGIVITHGTDTLEETSYLLARTVPATVPIVVTGAMRTSTDPEWDGPRNLRDAVAVAGHGESARRGTMVVFAGRILEGLSAVKLDAFSPDAFGTPHAAALGHMQQGAPRYDRPAGGNPRPLPVQGLTARVADVPLILGDDGALLDAARPHFDGVVVEGFGRGNVPPGAVGAIMRWLGDGKPVVLASRCPFGEVGGEYAFEGGGGQLLRQGVLAAGPTPRSLARLELLLCLSAGVPYRNGLA